MKLAKTTYDKSETGCCASLDEAKWNEREFIWKDKLFLKDHIRALMHIPLNMGSVMARDQKAIEEAAAFPADPLWLSDEVSPWGSDVYVAVDHPVANTETVKLSGTFLTKVFEGPYRDVGKWIKEMDAYVSAKGLKATRHLFYYATCPNCAKRFGKNQVVLFSEVADAPATVSRGSAATPRALALLVPLLLTACAPYAVRTDFDPTVSFRTLKTYAWVDSAPLRRDSLRNASPFLEQRLRRAVDKAFDSRGFRLEGRSDQADFLVSALVVGPSRMEQPQRLWASYRCPASVGVSFTFGRPLWYPYGYSRREPWHRYRDVYRWDPWGYACSYRLGYGYMWIPIYERPDGLQGTLVIDVFDRSSKELMWRGSAEGALFDREAGRSEAELDEIVTKVLQGFPPHARSQQDGNVQW